MTREQWDNFCSFKNAFKDKCSIWEKRANELGLSQLQSMAALQDNVPPYPIEHPVVYNTALDSVLESDVIKLIVIGDNPGKDEQLHKNRKYLVGLSGKIADGFFKKNSDLTIDFRKNVIILNKTPVHSAKTKELKKLAANQDVKKLIEESQNWMAENTAQLHTKLSCPLWLIGYAELKQKGIFTLYRDALQRSYTDIADFEKVYVFQHFSMNRFTIDLFNGDSSAPLKELLEQKGSLHRKEIFYEKKDYINSIITM